MSVWDLRQHIESMMPWWIIPVALVVGIALSIGISIGEKKK
jgi:hypothetical protein